MKKILLVVILAIAALLSGCYIDSGRAEYSYTFKNMSNHRVDVYPAADQGWDSFSIYPGETRTIYTNYSSIAYTYNNQSEVDKYKNSRGDIIFTDSIITPVYYAYDFFNSSSYSISVFDNNNQGWGNFTLLPGQSKSLKIAYSNIIYDYTPSASVYKTNVNGVITFKDTIVTPVKYNYTFKNNSSYTISIKPVSVEDWNGFTLKPGDLVTISTQNSQPNFVYSNSNYVELITNGTTKTFADIQLEYKLTVKNNSSTSVHLISWEPNGSKYYFTPDQEKSTYTEKGIVDTMKANNSYTNKVVKGESYLYYVLSGDNGFAYWRTKESIKIDDSIPVRVFTLSDNTVSIKTDSNKNDINTIKIVEIDANGKRGVERELEVIRVK